MEELLRGVGAVDHIGEELHLFRPQHGYDGLAGGEILIEPGRDHVVIGLAVPQQVQQNLAAAQIVGDLHQRAGAGQHHIGQAGETAQQRVFFPAPQQQEGPGGPGLGGIEDGGQIQVGMDGACPAQQGPGQVVQLPPTPGGARGGEERVIHPVGKQRDVAAARGEAVGQPWGSGKDHVRRTSQTALPPVGQLVPHLVAVVDQTVVLQRIQGVDMDRGGGPQKGTAEAVPGQLVGEKADLALPGEPEQPVVTLIHREGGGHGIDGDVGADLPARLAPALIQQSAAGAEVEDLGVLEPGDQVLGPAGGGAPGLGGETDDLLQKGGPPVFS